MKNAIFIILSFVISTLAYNVSTFKYKKVEGYHIVAAPLSNTMCYTPVDTYDITCKLIPANKKATTNIFKD